MIFLEGWEKETNDDEKEKAKAEAFPPTPNPSRSMYGSVLMYLVLLYPSTQSGPATQQAQYLPTRYCTLLLLVACGLRIAESDR